MMQQSRFYSAENIAVDENLSLLAALRVHEYDQLTVQVDVSGQDLDQFAILARTHSEAEFISLFDAAADFTSPAGWMLAANGDLTSQAQATSGLFKLDVGGFYEVKLYAASGNVAGSTVNLFAALR